MKAQAVSRAAGLTLSSALLTLPPTPASDPDKAFVAEVLQAGASEVAASKVAEQRARAQDVKVLASQGVHDHLLVGEKLKRPYTAASLKYPLTLNSEFQQRLASSNRHPQPTLTPPILKLGSRFTIKMRSSSPRRPRMAQETSNPLPPRPEEWSNGTPEP